MLRIFPIDEYAQRKKMLVAQSELHRQTLLVHVDTIKRTVAHYKRKFAIVSISSLAVSLGASLAEFFFARKRPAPPPEKTSEGGGGIVSKISSAFAMFNQAKSLFIRFTQPPGPDSGGAE